MTDERDATVAILSTSSKNALAHDILTSSVQLLSLAQGACCVVDRQITQGKRIFILRPSTFVNMLAAYFIIGLRDQYPQEALELHCALDAPHAVDRLAPYRLDVWSRANRRVFATVPEIIQQSSVIITVSDSASCSDSIQTAAIPGSTFYHHTPQQLMHLGAEALTQADCVAEAIDRFSSAFDRGFGQLLDCDQESANDI